MKLSGLIFLLKKNLFKKKARCFILIISFAFAILILGLSLSFFIGIQREVIPRLKKSFPENQIIISVKNIDLAIVKFSTSSINDEVVNKLKQVDGVLGVYPILTLNMPVRAEGDILGNEITTDLSVNGVDEEIVQSEVYKGYKFNKDAEPYLPVLVSQYFVDLYNLGIAESNNLPKLSDVAIIGRTFDLILGESTILPTSNPEKTKVVTCQVVGLTYNRTLLAVVAPIEKIKEYNEWYHNDAKYKYNRVIVKIKSPEAVESVSKFASENGLTITSEKKTLEQFMFLLRIILIIIFSFTLFILFLSVILIANHYSLIFLERKSEIGIFRALGGTPKQTFVLYFSEICIIGLVSGVIGFVVLKLIIIFLHGLIQQYLPSLMMLPKVIFYTPIWLFPLIIFFAVFLSLLSAVPLIYRFLMCEPATLLNED